jgi:kynureninase
VAIRHPDGRRLTSELAARGIIVDFREPDVMRFGLSPLTTSFEDVHRGLATLRGLL